MMNAEVVVHQGKDFVLDATVTAQDGEATVVIGPNGAGKTTLLRAVAGLEPLVRGRITIGDRVVDDVKAGIRVGPGARRVGFVFQDYRLFPHLSATENVAFGLRARGGSRVLARRRASALLREMGLRAVAESRPATLSGGEAQRVALARALATEPALLLLDEPLAALDAGSRDEMRSLLRRQIRLFPGPTVLITHDPLEALTLGDHLVVLEGGRVVQSGPAADLVRRPATPYVARIVGLNFWRGTLSAGVFAVDGGGEIVCTAGDLSGPAIAVLRPSAVTLYDVEPVRSSARNLLSGSVASVEAAGERSRVVVASTPPLVAEISMASLTDLRIEPGQRVWASVKATDVETYPAV